MMKKILFSGLLIASVASAELVDRVLAVVNNEIVTLSDLKEFSKKVEKNGMIDDLLLFGQKPETLKSNREKQMDYLIHEKIVDSEIKRLNLSVTIERVEQEIRSIAKKNGVSRAELMSAIKAQGMSPSDYQDFIKTRIERQALIEQEITSKIRVSDEDVMAQFTRMNPSSGGGVHEFTIAHIVFRPKKGGLAAAKERAQSALKKIRSGTPFETVAEQTSEDPNFSNGGVLGTFKTGELNPEMEKAINPLGVGEVSNIVQTKSGFQIIKLLNKKTTTDPRFDKEKEQVRAQLFEKAFQKHFQNWLQEKRRESFIRINQ